LDEWVGILSRGGVLPECIVAGLVPLEGLSEDEVPLRDVELSQEREGELLSRFVVEEVVPFLDQRYRTVPKSSSRTVIGAGLAGLRAFWTAMGYPEVFGKAACLSTSFEDVSQSVPDRSRSLIALEEGIFPPTNGRFYFDYGQEGLDECYGIYHTVLSGLLREKGWRLGTHMEIHNAPGGSHSDLSWRQRIGDALRWLAR
jgi:S-formylglutathione hydrolase FrmB